MIKTYYVARVRPWHGGAHKTSSGRPSRATLLQAVTNIDCLSCDVLAPIRVIEANTLQEAIATFRKG